MKASRDADETPAAAERWRLQPWMGAVLVLVLLFGWAFQRQRAVVRDDGGEGRPVVTIGHWQQQTGTVAGLDAVIAAYREIRPEVIVRQIVVPDRIYQTWLRTQLVGGTAPQIVEVHGGHRQGETVPRYLLALDRWLVVPNPYNAGTPLEGVPWRDTFLDGVSSGYEAALAGHYVWPWAFFTLRLYVNVDLWRAAFGEEPTPEDFEGFLARCVRFREWAHERGLQVQPMASSLYQTHITLDRIGRGVTQALLQANDPVRTLRFNSVTHGGLLLRGRWTMDDPVFQVVERAYLDTTAQLAPGWPQMSREDAMFQFLSGRALTFITGSWEARSLARQASFPVMVLPLLEVSPESPRFRGMQLAPVAEVGDEFTVGFALRRDAPHLDETVDFMRFLFSVPGMELFSPRSGWVSPLATGDPPAELAPFAPVREGLPPGFITRNFGPNSTRLYDAMIYRLAEGEAGGFTQTIARDLPGAVAADQRNFRRHRIAALRRNEVALTARLLGPARIDEVSEGSREAVLVDPLGALFGSQLRQTIEVRWIDEGLQIAAEAER